MVGVSVNGHARSHAAAADTGKDAGGNELRHVPGETTHEASQTKDGVREQQTRLATWWSSRQWIVIAHDKPSPKMSLNLPYSGLVRFSALAGLGEKGARTGRT